MRTPRQRTGLLAVLLSCAMLLGGCGFSVYSLPLPGGADTGKNPLTVTASFDNVLDLVPQSTVKKDDVDVGKITQVELVKEQGVSVARVTMQIRRDAKLPDDTVARIGQTSLLGEKYVELDEPQGGGSGVPMADEGHIPLSRTGRNPEVEEVLGALSLILNGGGVAQLKTISTELNNALGGREDSARSVLHQVNTLVTNLDRNKGAIVTALRKVTNLSREVRRQRGTINATLDELPSALDSIDKQRQDLKKMLRALSKLSSTGVRVIRASKASTVKVIRDLQPILYQLGLAGDDFVESMNTLLTYPFVDAAVGYSPEVARNLHMGDYVNLDIKLRLNLADTPIPVDCTTLSQLADQNLTQGQLENLLDGTGANQLCDGVIDALNECKTVLNGDLQDLPAKCQGIPEALLKGLGEIVGKAPGVIEDLLGSLPGGRSAGGGSGGGSSGGGTGGLLDGVGGLLNRAPVGGPNPDGTYDVPVKDLSTEYDKDLMSLMLPGLGAEVQEGRQ